MALFLKTTNPETEVGLTKEKDKSIIQIRQSPGKSGNWFLWQHIFAIKVLSHLMAP